MAVSKLIPGFRFHPTGVELVKYFLKRKILGKKFHDGVITELDIYKYAPWDLPDKSCLKIGDLEWYFFCPSEKKYGSGARINRATEIGYWKATGKDRAVQQNNQTVGMIKTLIFHTGKAPRGDRTDWVMHEYRLEDKDLADKGIPQDSYVICKVFQKEGLGPRNGAQYGKPFNEEDWDDDEMIIPLAESSALVPILPVASTMPVPDDQNLHTNRCSGSASMSCLSGLTNPSPGLSDPSPGLADPSHPSNQTVNNDDDDDDDDDILSMLDIFEDDITCNRSVPNDQNLHSGRCSDSSLPCLSGLTNPSPGPANPSHPSNQTVNDDDDDILSMLDIFKEDGTLLENFDISGQENVAEGAPSNDFYDGLGDLDWWAALGSSSCGQNAELSTNGMVSTDDNMWHGDLDFLELIDLDSPLFWQNTESESLNPTDK